MLTNHDFKFDISVSTGNYATKKPEKAWTIQYSHKSINIAELETLQREGKSFCYNFKEVSDSGLITAHEKTLAGFDFTNVIFFDIDKMEIAMEDYIAPIPYKPTLSYTTISNGKNGYYGYRLIYALDEPLRSIEDFDAMYYAIAAANGFRQRQYPDGTKYEFDYRKVNQQYYGGGLNSDTYRTDYVYSVADFSEFIEQGKVVQDSISCGKKTKTKQSKTNSIIPSENIIRRAQEGQAYYSEMENPFYNALFSLKPTDFLLSYESTMLDVYFQSLQTTLLPSADGRYWIYPEDYQEVKRNWRKDSEGKRCVQKWRIGSGRKKRMYITAQIMKHNVPDITQEELVYNLIKERFYYYDNTDDNLNNKFIIQVAKNTLETNFPLSPCKHPSFKVNKEYCKAVSTTPNKAKNEIRKERKEEEVLSMYDFNLSVKENLEMLRENGINVGKSYLYNLRKKYDA